MWDVVKMHVQYYEKYLVACSSLIDYLTFCKPALQCVFCKPVLQFVCVQTYMHMLLCDSAVQNMLLWDNAVTKFCNGIDRVSSV